VVEPRPGVLLDFEVGVTAAPILRVRRILVVGAHLLLVPFAYHVAVRLVAGTPLPADAIDLFVRTAPLVIVLRIAAFGWFRLFDGWWSNAGMHDLTDLVKAVTASTVLLALYFAGVGGVGSIPGSLAARHRHPLGDARGDEAHRRPLHGDGVEFKIVPSLHELLDGARGSASSATCRGRGPARPRRRRPRPRRRSPRTSRAAW
jgi:hypothetical protein